MFWITGNLPGNQTFDEWSQGILNLYDQYFVRTKMYGMATSLQPMWQQHTREVQGFCNDLESETINGKE